MSYKGKLIRDRYVLFGSDLNEVTKDKINSACPTGDDIIRSLPPSSFMPVESKENSDEKKIPEKKIEKRKNRVKRKKEVAAKKKLVESILKEQTTIEKIISKGNEMTLSNDLDSLIDEAKPKQEEKAAVKSEPETITQEGSQDTMRSQILSMLASDPNAPSMEEIDSWKEAYGSNGIHVMSFGDADNYIYHHLTRGEWKKIKDVMKALRDSENAEELEEKLKERVVCSCILWPSADEKWLDQSKAGAVDSLYQMILLNSGFLTPQQAMLLTTQL